MARISRGLGFIGQNELVEDPSSVGGGRYLGPGRVAKAETPAGDEVIIVVSNEEDNLFEENTPEKELEDEKAPIGEIVDTPETALSLTSTKAPFSTLFNDFKLKATPVYNYYVDNETTDENQVKGQLAYDDLPRYIRLSWVSAPLLNQSSNFSKARPPSTKNIRTSTLIDQNRHTAIMKNGMSFKTNVDFRTAIKSLANGYLTPGVITATVEMPNDDSINLPPDVRRTVINEKEYLRSEDAAGISIHDLQGVVNRIVNDVDRALDIAASSDADKAEYFDDKTSVRRESFSRNSNMIVRSIAASSPMLSMKIATSTTSRSATGDVGSNRRDQVDSMLERFVSRAVDEVDTEALDYTEVNFVDINLDNTRSPLKNSQMKSPENVENTIAIAGMIPELSKFNSIKDTLSVAEEVPSFSAGDDENRIEYVGYVIEKYRMSDSGFFELMEEIPIERRSATEYYDINVAYGAVYRYRIRSILKWTRPKGENDSIFTDFVRRTGELAQNISSFFHSEWNREWKYAQIIDMIDPDPPDEITVRPISEDKSVSINIKLPYNPQRDISHFRIFRKELDEFDKPITDWQLIHVSSGPVNTLFIDRSVSYFQDSKKSYAYAAQTVSLHREYSRLTDQLVVRLNKNYQYSDEFPIRHISCAGVKLSDIWPFSRRPIIKTFVEMVPKRVIEISGRSSMSNSIYNNSTFCFRLHSLDTGDTHDLLVEYDVIVLPNREIYHDEIVAIPLVPIDSGPSFAQSYAVPVMSFDVSDDGSDE